MTELESAAKKLIEEIFAVQPGETVTITTDYDSMINLEKDYVTYREISLKCFFQHSKKVR